MPTPDDAYPYLSDLVKALTGADLPLPVPMFGLLVLLAVGAATVVLRIELRRRWSAGELAGDPGVDPTPPDGDTSSGRVGVRRTSRAVTSLEGLDEFTTTFAAAMLLSGIAGAKLFSVAEDPGAVFADPVGQVFSSNGFNIIGGLVVATAVGVILLRRKGIRVAPFLDAAAPALMLGYAVGRIGCQVSGDGDWGVAAGLAGKPGWLPTWLWAQQYQGNILGVQIPAPGVHPTPIWETAMALVLFGVLWALRRHPYRAGWLFSLWIVLAAAERLAIEPFRVNELHGPLHLSQAQYLSAVFLVVGLAGVVRFRARRTTAPDPERVDLSRA
ncbi:prolipoprotein diacylglyceryl transferase [Intrasporangium sp. YIM S08009]|uniref:prolipoprotein diacylglyceryl transferase n=1 Tax=Intrasporangium zincisolvens TaxID=3080018 RepID=UPI002B061C8D|nr:prolipoprotein diacylglyceryl transferase family protein [Intrasporangium sp. YIM S08009]